MFYCGRYAVTVPANKITYNLPCFVAKAHAISQGEFINSIAVV
jgi:hypothetical protein